MKYESNLSVVIKGTKDKINAINAKGGAADRTQREIALSLLAANLNRVFKSGINVNEATIGTYSTKPTLVGASSFRNKSSVAKVFTKTKNKKAKWVTVKGHALRVLDGGYKEIRSIDGDYTDSVILKRTGKMFRELHTEPKNADWVIGFPKQYQTGLSYRAMIDNFEKKYNGQIWGVSKKEEEIVRKIIQKNINLA